MLVPGGFGERGIEGKIAAARFARERGMPYFGLCLGMQVATIEFARNVAGWQEANSSEFDPASPQKVIDLLADQAGDHREGRHHAARRLPLRAAARAAWPRAPTARPRSRSATAIATSSTTATRPQLQSRGLVLSGKCVGRELVEIIELPDHPWFLAVQFHPELKSRPHEPHPLFVDFVRAALERRRVRLGDDRYRPPAKCDGAPEAATPPASEPEPRPAHRRPHEALPDRRRRGRRAAAAA